MECMFECGEYITRKMMKQHCQQQCKNVKRILLQQQDDKFIVTCIAVQDTDETYWLNWLMFIFEITLLFEYISYSLRFLRGRIKGQMCALFCVRGVLSSNNSALWNFKAKLSYAYY